MCFYRNVLEESIHNCTGQVLPGSVEGPTSVSVVLDKDTSVVTCDALENLQSQAKLS